MIGINVGDQLRIVVQEHVAIYTVERKCGEKDVIALNGNDRLSILKDSSVDGYVQGPCVISTRNLSETEAKAKSELIEKIIIGDTEHDGFICIAPHGGDIDLKTDYQAERVHKALYGTTLWMCKGYKRGGGAFKQWHVTSNDISPNSFPGLQKLVASKKKFSQCVAFHGMAEGGVLIGGQGPVELKRALQKLVREKIGDETIPVSLATRDDCCNGLSSRNIVNWLTKDGHGGIQIEQDRKVRHRYWQCVADAVIEIFAPLYAKEAEDTLLSEMD